MHEIDVLIRGEPKVDVDTMDAISRSVRGDSSFDEEGVFLAFRYLTQYDLYDSYRNDSSLSYPRKLHWKLAELTSKDGWKFTLARLIFELKILLSYDYTICGIEPRYEIYHAIIETLGLLEYAGVRNHLPLILADSANSLSLEDAMKKIREKMSETLRVQIKSGGSTLFLDIDKLKEGQDAHLVPYIIDLRQKEIENIKVTMYDDEQYDFTDLMFTNYGIELMRALKVWIIGNKDDLEQVTKRIEEIDGHINVVKGSEKETQRDFDKKDIVVDLAFNYVSEKIDYDDLMNGFCKMGEIGLDFGIRVIQSIYGNPLTHSSRSMIEALSNLRTEESLELLGKIASESCDDFDSVLVAEFLPECASSELATVILDNMPYGEDDLLSIDGKQSPNIEDAIRNLTKFNPDGFLEYLIDVASIFCNTEDGCQQIPTIEKSITEIVPEIEKQKWILHGIREMLNVDYNEERAKFLKNESNIGKSFTRE